MNNHRSIAEELDLLHTEPSGPGMVFWHPNGWRLFRAVKQHMRQVYEMDGFLEISTPQFLKRELWETSGHWEKFSENMFIGGPAESYALKPMSCPAHILGFKREVLSYRSLPYKVFEFGSVHRNEPSGALNGLMRLRQFTQDDAHVLCQWEQCVDEILNFLTRAKCVYNDYGYKSLDVRVSTRPNSYFGCDEDWIKAEKLLEEACEAAQLKFTMQDGEGAFYGPKIELVLRDRQDRQWQCGTIQLDFNMPNRFNLTYIDKSGKPQFPVMLHQAIYGSLERWIGVLLESNNGKLPPWIHPTPVAIVPIGSRAIDHCQLIKDELNKEGVHILINSLNVSVSKKIKLFHKQKIPIVLIVGEKEVAENSFSLWLLDGARKSLSFGKTVAYIVAATKSK